MRTGRGRRKSIGPFRVLSPRHMPIPRKLSPTSRPPMPPIGPCRPNCSPGRRSCAGSARPVPYWRAWFYDALVIEPLSSWPRHTVAHVMEMTGCPEDAIFGLIGLARQVQVREGAVHMRRHDLARRADIGFVELVVAGDAEQRQSDADLVLEDLEQP